ncbi:MAG: Macrolide export protein MacA [Alphaproteobacteria bacterium ADurb.Bin438]|nr:MAG: Macrolide export protein MacA [Alphaproteobacteria bacterium ADurb.Bin438]
MLAELDKSLLLEDLNESEANFNKTKTALNFAKINYKRNKELFSKDYISKLDLEESEVKFAEAKASYETALSKLKKAKKNLGYARITSPISGVIISKEVESGQTVASSFQTPTLFEIAEDLTKMQISALVSESDIGMIKMNQEVDFTVDAYPLKTFKGKVSQIRLNPTTESNVVMYTVVIAFDNNTMELLPGMTAFVTIKIDSLKKVIRIPNMAFQYRPYPVKEKISNNEAFVYLLDKEGKEQRVLIKKGLSNSTHTEVLEGLKDKDKIIYEAIGGVIKGSKKRR